jgi:hypothetical protein
MLGAPGEHQPVALEDGQQDRREPVARRRNRIGRAVEQALQARAHVARVHSPPW